MFSGPVTASGELDLGPEIRSDKNNIYDVKLLFFRSEFDASKQYHNYKDDNNNAATRSKCVYELDVKGKLQRQERSLPRQFSAVSFTNSEDEHADNHELHASPQQGKDHHDEHTHIATLLVDMAEHFSANDKSQLNLLLEALSSTTLPAVFELKCIISLNEGQDYTAINHDAAMCSMIHNFSPSIANPCCLSASRLSQSLRDYTESMNATENDDIDQLRNALEEISKIKIIGKNFVPSLKVTTSFCFYYAINHFPT